MTTNKLPNLPLILVIVVTILLPLQMTKAHIMEIILDEDSPPVAAMASSVGNVVDGFDESGGNGMPGCSVEFQVMKKIPGRCVRLGGRSRGCVSGSHIIPFHPDCL